MTEMYAVASSSRSEGHVLSRCRWLDISSAPTSQERRSLNQGEVFGEELPFLANL